MGLRSASDSVAAGCHRNEFDVWVGLAATRTILAISHSCSGAARPQPIVPE